MGSFAGVAMWLLMACLPTVLAQLASPNNETMPTSQFMTRPQAYAPIFNITTHGSGYDSSEYIFMAPYQHPGAGPYIYDKSGNLVWDGFGIAGPADAHGFGVCQYQGAPHLCFAAVNQQTGYGAGQGVILDNNYRTVVRQTPKNGLGRHQEALRCETC